MVKAAGLKSASEVTDYFAGRFLSVDLQEDSKRAIANFAQQALGGQIDLSDPDVEHSLREILHLILNAPEYQLG